jgi:hypothetical protein
MTEYRVFYDTWPAWTMPVMRYLHNLFIAVDQLGTALIGGWPDETISSYLFRLEQQGKPAGRLFRPVVDVVWLAIFRQRDHCRMASEAERLRHQLPPALR